VDTGEPGIGGGGDAGAADAGASHPRQSRGTAGAALPSATAGTRSATEGRVGGQGCLVDVQRTGIVDAAAQAQPAVITVAADAARAAVAPITGIPAGPADAAAG
jgi:hypothetical protein